MEEEISTLGTRGRNAAKQSSIFFLTCALALVILRAIRGVTEMHDIGLFIAIWVALMFCLDSEKAK
jgi:hypothetical protein